MKKLLSLKNILIAIAFTVLLLLIKDNMDIVFSILSAIGEILTPFAIGFLFAYILNYPYKFFYTKAFGKMGTKRKFFGYFRKPLAIILTYAIVAAVFVVIIAIVMPQIVVNLMSLVDNLPSYYKAFQENISGFLSWSGDKFNISFDPDAAFDKIVAKLSQYLSLENLTKVYEAILSTAGGVYNFIMGLVISVYFLASKETLCRLVKKLAVAFIPIRFLPKIYEIVDITDTKCGRFLVGDIIDAAFLGVLTFITMTIFRIPYAPLISVLVGVTNIIPFFGPFIGAIPSAFILLLIDPWQMIKFVIIIFFIQQLDGNLFKPKIIGSQVGLSSFWVLFSVMVGGAMFGVMGMILGTPVYAVIYALVKKRADNKIREKGKIAQEALDFEVLNYTKIAAEQKRIREEKENQQKEKLRKLIGFNKNDEDSDASPAHKNSDNAKAHSLSEFNDENDAK